jgi:hypothetical protein
MNEFRVYKCHECGNVGFDRVTNKETDSHCSLCNTAISHRPEAIYVSTLEEARRRAGVLATMTQASASKVTMSLGLRRRIFDIVESLVNMNRGRPVTLEEVLAECVDAGIARDRAMHFLDVLRDEERITHDNESVMVFT